MSKSRKIVDGIMYSTRRSRNGAKNSSCSGEYVAATVVHARLMKTRFSDVDHEENMGIARNEASGRVMGARSEESDIFTTRVRWRP
jgi:hypothetical protein